MLPARHVTVRQAVDGSAWARARRERGRGSSAGRGRPAGLRAARPGAGGALHLDAVGVALAVEGLAEVPAVAALGIRQHRARLEAPRPPARQARQGEVRLGPVLEGRGNPDFGAALRVGGPLLREVERPGEGHRRGVGPEVDGHRDLAVRRLPEGPAILPGHPDRVGPLLREAGAIDEVDGLREQRIDHRMRERLLDRLPGPRTLVHELPERLHVGPREPRRHRLNGLALPIEEQASDVHLGPVPPCGAAQTDSELLEEAAEATLGGLERSRVHARSLRRPGHPVNIYLT